MCQQTQGRRLLLLQGRLSQDSTFFLPLRGISPEFHQYCYLKWYSENHSTILELLYSLKLVPAAKNCLFLYSISPHSFPLLFTFIFKYWCPTLLLIVYFPPPPPWNFVWPRASYFSSSPCGR